jgi:hypothetical protein
MATRFAALVMAAALASMLPAVAWPWTVSIAAGTSRVYIQAGVGAISGAPTYLQGGTPGTSSVTNVVSVTPTPANYGNGALTMTSDSTATTSFYDGATVCPNSPGPQVYIGGFYRGGNSDSATARLLVTSPANLVNAQNQTIPFSKISWTTSISRTPDSVQMPSGSFAGTANQLLMNVPKNTWFEDCFTFTYANDNANLLSGVYTGTVTYTLISP